MRVRKGGLRIGSAFAAGRTGAGGGAMGGRTGGGRPANPQRAQAEPSPLWEPERSQAVKPRERRAGPARVAEQLDDVRGGSKPANPQRAQAEPSPMREPERSQAVKPRERRAGVWASRLPAARRPPPARRTARSIRLPDAMDLCRNDRPPFPAGRVASQTPSSGLPRRLPPLPDPAWVEGDRVGHPRGEQSPQKERFSRRWWVRARRQRA